MSSYNLKHCKGCGAKIPLDIEVCPQCGKASGVSSTGQSQFSTGFASSEYSHNTYQDAPLSFFYQLCFYAVSFFVPFLGMLIGLIFLTRKHTEKKKLGTRILVISVLLFILDVLMFWGGLAFSIVGFILGLFGL